MSGWGSKCPTFYLPPATNQPVIYILFARRRRDVTNGGAADEETWRRNQQLISSLGRSTHPGRSSVFCIFQSFDRLT